MFDNLALPHIKKVQAYPVPGQRCCKGIINLDFNERIPSGVADPSLRCSYPEYAQLITSLAGYTTTAPENILPCNGSDQAIDLIMRTFAEPGSTAIIPQPSFAMYPQWAAVNRLKTLTPAYNTDYRDYPVSEVLASVDETTRIIFVCNPNNPTGAQTDLATIALLAATARQSIIFVDEAYGEYSNVSALELLAEYPNIIISRTFSKAFGLAGHRIGYLLASRQHVAELRKVRGPFDVNSTAASAVQLALADTRAMQSYCSEIVTLAKPLVENELDRLEIKYVPSAANFILIQHADAENIAGALMQSGWRVKPLQLAGLGNCMRVTIGPVETMQQWLTAFKKILFRQVNVDA